MSDVSLQKARELATEWRSVVAGGKGSIVVRARDEKELSARDIRLATLATEAFEARKAELKGDGAAGR